MKRIRMIFESTAGRLLALGLGLKLAIGTVAYVLLADMHQLATAAL